LSNELSQKSGVNEAELVLTHVLNCDRLSLYLNKDSKLDKDKSALFSSILKRRIKGQPVQYILGSSEFMGLKFKVDKRVLIPRPETEILVEAAIEGLKNIEKPDVLDIGTGSGCIAVSLAKNIPNCKIMATDISPEALELAGQNADLYRVKIEFLRSDLFAGLRLKEFDLIISNPPYVPTRELKSLAREISFEPVLALDGGSDGLDFYRRIISQASGYLKKGGLLVFEVGINQAGQVKDMLETGEKFDDLRIIKDYNNIQRVVIARRII